jgi:hypothetical protein
LCHFPTTDSSFNVTLLQFVATAHPWNQFNSVIKQTGKSAKWFGIQTVTVTSGMALGPVGIWSIFEGLKTAGT